MFKNITSIGKLSSVIAVFGSFSLQACCITADGVRFDCQDEEFESEEQIKDPFEDFNRAMFDVNYTMDRAFLNPTVQLYKKIFPSAVRQGVGSALSNLSEPLTVVHGVLQLDAKKVGKGIARLFINTVFGFFGTIDAASKLGLKKETQDGGKTLGKYGVKSGPFLILPVIGPTNFRDLLGFTGDIFIDPINYMLRQNDRQSLQYWRYGSATISGRETLDKNLNYIYSQSDPYTRMKILFMLRREAEINPDKAFIKDLRPTSEDNIDF